MAHVPGLERGIWTYLHVGMYGEGEALTARLDEVVLHELLHNELRQFGEDPTHKGEAWACRCQEISDRLGLTVHIERPRSIRRDGRVTTGTPPGCLPYDELASWPANLLADGPPLRARLAALV